MFELAAQRFDIFETAFVADSGNQFDLYCAVVDILVEVEQMCFEPQFAVVGHGRTAADVDHGIELPVVVYRDAGGIYAGPDLLLLAEDYVCRCKTECMPESVSVCNLAFQKSLHCPDGFCGQILSVSFRTRRKL